MALIQEGFAGVLSQSVALFDKRVDVLLRRADGTEVTIQTPETGRKPTIRLSGKIVSNGLVQEAEIRITNFVTDEPLSEYKQVSVRAGYAGMMQAAFAGEVLNSYQETPGPDGVTFFQMLTGNFTDWVSKPLSAWYESGTPLSVVLADIAKQVQMSPLDLYPASTVIPIGIGHCGLAKDLIRKLVALFPDLVVQPDGGSLIAYRRGDGTGLVYRLDYISAAKRNAAGFDVQAPWLPAIRPGDTVEIDAKYFRQELGAPGTLGSPASSGNRFRVLMIDFQFCTTDDTNMMTLTSVGGDV